MLNTPGKVSVLSERAVGAFAAVVLSALSSTAADGAVIEVAPGQSVQAAIDSAQTGDTIMLDAGAYTGDLDYGGKAVEIVGVGPETVIRGSGVGPVVTFANGETDASVLDSVTVTGGIATRGGGIYVFGAGPTIVRTVITENRATLRGSGIHIENGAPLIANNLILYSGHAGGDPHGIEIVDAAPIVVNNTIARGDSNGIILRGDSPAAIFNNIITANGARIAGRKRGRGICDFSGGRAEIHYNAFHRNRVAAILSNARDYRRIGKAEAAIGLPRFIGNFDGPPGFAGRTHRDPARTEISAFRLHETRRRVRARDTGHPDAAYNDPDGSRNDVGASGGPAAPPWLR